MKRRGQNECFHVVSRRLTPTKRCPPIEDVVADFAIRPDAFVLESTDAQHPQGRFSIFGLEPTDVVEFPFGSHSDWLEALADRIGPGDPKFGHPFLPFVGGWVGFIAYEAGPPLESIHPSAPRDIDLPLIRFALYDTVALFDHHHQTWWLAGTKDATQTSCFLDRPPLPERLDTLEDLLTAVPTAPSIDLSRPIAADPLPTIPRDEYLKRVETAKRYIQAGDIYQVNLTQRFTAQTDAPPVEIYRRLRWTNPAPLSALLVRGDSAVISASPELFIELRGRRIITRPIKGTRPRVGDDVLDAVRARELLESDKDRAELNMIVDLLRNDLGKVSDFGTVRVESSGDLETHPTVFHRVATIAARLRDGLGWCDLLRAALPGGSITGTPKIRAMQIIDELETTMRSVYCGSIGYIGLDGSCCFNVAIRTMLLDRGRIHLFGGGAIVADSDAQDEYDETLAKTAGMMRALSLGPETSPRRTAATRETS